MLYYTPICYTKLFTTVYLLVVEQMYSTMDVTVPQQMFLMMQICYVFFQKSQSIFFFSSEFLKLPRQIGYLYKSV